MKEKPPAFQFYPKDWLSGEHMDIMTYEDKGKYIDLLCRCWTNDGISTESFKHIRPSKIVAKKFYLKDGRYQNKRLDEEREKQENRLAAMSEGGKKSALLKWGDRPAKTTSPYDKFKDGNKDE